MTERNGENKEKKYRIEILGRKEKGQKTEETNQREEEKLIDTP